MSRVFDHGVSGLALAREVARYCQSQGMTQRELARKAGIDPATVLSLGHRGPTARTIDRLRAAMVAFPAQTTVRKPAIYTLGYRGDAPEHQRVDRDPCGWCGVRRDHGCHHFPKQVAA